MASATQVAPKTEDTKESLRTPAVKHGPTAKLYTNTVLQGEDQAAYNHMLQSLLAEATLGTTQEAMLIQVLAQSFWKMQRASNMEAGALNSGLAAAQLQLKLTEKPKNDNELSEQLAFVLWEYAGKLDTVRRYVNAAERAFFRATKELAHIRKAGPQEQVESRRGAVRDRMAVARFLSPLIKPDVPISSIRLSDRVHTEPTQITPAPDETRRAFRR
jgi:hypothetical protein